jgi:hypothetical protein
MIQESLQNFKLLLDILAVENILLNVINRMLVVLRLSQELMSFRSDSSSIGQSIVVKSSREEQNLKI